MMRTYWRTFPLSKLVWLTAAVLLVALSGCGSQSASSGTSSGDTTKLAVVVGGPHPYFAPMPAAVQAAKNDFHIAEATYRVPTAITLNDENQAIESLASQGYNSFAIFPADANGSNATIPELQGKGILIAEVRACTNPPTQARFCLATDVYQAAYSATQQLIQVLGGHGKIVHLTVLLIVTNTTLRVQAVQNALSETNRADPLVQSIYAIDTPSLV